MCFQNIEGKRTIIEEIDIDELPIEEDLPQEDYDDLDEFTFSKFASMYFQGGVTPTHIRQRLRKPLLYHEDEEDIQVQILYLLKGFFPLFLLPWVTLVFVSSGFADGVVDYSEVHGRPPGAKETDQSSAEFHTGAIHATGLDRQERQTSEPHGGPGSGGSCVCSFPHLCGRHDCVLAFLSALFVSEDAKE